MRGMLFALLRASYLYSQSPSFEPQYISEAVEIFLEVGRPDGVQIEGQKSFSCGDTNETDIQMLESPSVWVEFDRVARNQQVCAGISHSTVPDDRWDRIETIQDIWVDIHAGKSHQTVEALV